MGGIRMGKRDRPTGGGEVVDLSQREVLLSLRWCVLDLARARGRAAWLGGE